MVNRTLARRYATAIYDIAIREQAVDRIGADFQRIVQSIESDEETNRFFLAPVVDRYEKERALTKALEGHVEEIALHALLLLVRKHREALLRPVLEEYRALEMGGRGLEPLVVTSARPLRKGALEAIVSRIEGIYGRRFEAQLRVDPGVIGGLRITMGDRRIDGTVAGRLEQLARTLNVPL